MEKIPHAGLRAYVVWLPVLRAGNVESAAHRESGRVADPRATHYFDADARLARRFSEIIALPQGLPAWDVYLVFDAKARWDAIPPKPTSWMHQLGRGAPSELRLNGEQLARVVSGLLGASLKTASAGWQRENTPIPAGGNCVTSSHCQPYRASLKTKQLRYIQILDRPGNFFPPSDITGSGGNLIERQLTAATAGDGRRPGG